MIGKVRGKRMKGDARGGETFSLLSKEREGGVDLQNNEGKERVEKVHA